MKILGWLLVALLLGFCVLLVLEPMIPGLTAGVDFLSLNRMLIPVFLLVEGLFFAFHIYSAIRTKKSQASARSRKQLQL